MGFRVEALAAALVLVATLGCTSGDSGQAGGESHWYWPFDQVCVADSECSEGQVCSCGACLQACGAAAGCGSGYACVATDTALQNLSCPDSDDAPAAMCLPECSTDSDCEALPTAAACETGACVPLTPSPVDTSDAADATAGGDASDSPDSSSPSDTETGTGPESDGDSDPDVSEGDDALVGPDATGRDTTERDVLGDAAVDTMRVVDEAVVDPDTLTYFFLPIGSARFGVSGWIEELELCVTFVWWQNTAGNAWCTPETVDGQPFDTYITIEPSTDSTCGGWDYGPNLEMVDFEGCASTGSPELGSGAVAAVNASAEVVSELFSGTIVMRSEHFDQTPPSYFGIEFISDIPESLYVASQTPAGIPGWVQILDGEDSLSTYDLCGVPLCGDPSLTCEPAPSLVTDIGNGLGQGRLYLPWDGHFRVLNPDEGCVERIAAEDKAYTARFCWGWGTEDTGDGLQPAGPVCEDVEFTPSTPLTVLPINNGG